MRQFLAHYRQQPRESLQYYVDYSQWLDDGETISSSQLEVDLITDPPLDLSNTFVQADVTVTFSVGGGLSGTTYQVTILTTTSTGQVVEREINYTVEEL